MRRDREVEPQEKPEPNRHDWPLPTDYPNIIPFSDILEPEPEDSGQEIEQEDEREQLLVQSADDRR